MKGQRKEKGNKTKESGDIKDGETNGGARDGV